MPQYHSATYSLTFPPHSDLDALVVAAVLALVAVMLVDWARLLGAARVGEVATDAPLEEALASLAGVLAVVLPARLVTTNLRVVRTT